MADNPNIVPDYRRSPFFQLSAALVIVLGLGTILFLVIVLSGSLLFHIDASFLASPSVNPGARELNFLRFALASQDICFFIIPSFIILLKINPGYEGNIFSIKYLAVTDIVLVAVLALFAFPLTGLTGELNARMTLPGWLSGIEQWMHDKEDYADDLLSLIMSKGSFGGMLLNIFLIAALPAISEELIFRGVFQKILQNLLRSDHAGVWITAFFFSAIHMQFFGFLPRFILGLIFGYLFLWSGNLWLPVIAHFINNAVPTVGVYLRGWDAINASSGTAIGKLITGGLLSLAAVIAVLIYFRSKSSARKEVRKDPVKPDE